MMLWNPTSPDPFPALRVVEDQLKTLLSRRNDETSKNLSGFALLKTVFILHLQGTTSEAQRAQRLLQQNFGHIWKSRRQIIDSFVKDPKLQHLLGLKAAASATIQDDEDQGVLDNLLFTRRKSAPE
jgi:hypothetical protein